MLVEMFGVAMLVNMQRGRRLFIERIAVLEKITKVKAAADRRTNAYVFVDVELKDDRGATLMGKVTTISTTKYVDAREGNEVPVLYLQRLEAVRHLHAQHGHDGRPATLTCLSRPFARRPRASWRGWGLPGE